MKAGILVFAFVFCAVGAAAAEESAKPEPLKLLDPAVAEMLALDQQRTGQPTADRGEWQRRLDAAQAKRSKGIRYVFIGLGMGVGGSVLAATAGADISVDRFGNIEDSGSAMRTVGILTSLGGAGVFWYGVYNWLKGGDEVDTLDREGRANGFLTYVPAITPTNGGVQLATTIRF